MARSRKKDPEVHTPEVRRMLRRRRFLGLAASGTAVAALGGFVWVLDDDITDEYIGLDRDDGRARVPPGQRVIRKMRNMGGREGDPDPSRWTLRVHGDVDEPFEVDFRDFLALDQSMVTDDVHCVTSWSAMDLVWRGVQVAELARLAGVRPEANYVIFEAAHGYTANLPLAEAMKPNVVLAHELDGDPLEHVYGGPVRSVVPELYFWKSAKWITGVRFQTDDEPGYWETRGYHNYADPWQEQRYG